MRSVSHLRSVSQSNLLSLAGQIRRVFILQAYSRALQSSPLARRILVTSRNARLTGGASPLASFLSWPRVRLPTSKSSCAAIVKRPGLVGRRGASPWPLRSDTTEARAHLTVGAPRPWPGYGRRLVRQAAGSGESPWRPASGRPVASRPIPARLRRSDPASPAAVVQPRARPRVRPSYVSRACSIVNSIIAVLATLNRSSLTACFSHVSRVSAYFAARLPCWDRRGAFGAGFLLLLGRASWAAPPLPFLARDTCGFLGEPLLKLG